MECPGLKCQFHIEVVGEVNNSMENMESGLKAEETSAALTYQHLYSVCAMH